MKIGEQIGAILYFGVGDKLELHEETAKELKDEMLTKWNKNVPKCIHFNNCTVFVERINYIEWFI